jgi:cell division protein FtsB
LLASTEKFEILAVCREDRANVRFPCRSLGSTLSSVVADHRLELAHLERRYSLAAFVGYVPYRLYVRTGLQQHIQLRRELRQLVERNDKVRRENSELRLQLLRVQEDDTEIERVARDELGLIHSDELLFKVE